MPETTPSDGLPDASYSANLPAMDLLRMTSSVVAAYLARNPIATEEVTQLIRTIHGAFAALRDGGGKETLPQRPAVPIRKSITNDYIICLEDGRKMKMLKRHLRTTYGMTPEDYRAKWGLSADYPMVAPSYARQRSAFAKEIGLGRTTRGGLSTRGGGKGFKTSRRGRSSAATG